MAKESRSLTAALKSTPEKERFLNGTQPNTLHISPKPVSEEKLNESAEPTRKANEAKTTVSDISTVRDKPSKNEKNRKSKEKTKTKPEQATLFQPRVPIYARLTSDTATKLLEASLTRKPARLSPWTQQDIIEEAVLEWLAK